MYAYTKCHTGLTVVHPELAAVTISYLCCCTNLIKLNFFFPYCIFNCSPPWWLTLKRQIDNSVSRIAGMCRHPATILNTSVTTNHRTDVAGDSAKTTSALSETALIRIYRDSAEAD